jgi:DeoR family transcriptional regulator of aga operon
VRKLARNIGKRRQAICDMVNQNGSVNFTQLKECFPGVSEVTLRKDLQYLDETQQIIRIHGGAKALPQTMNFVYRSSIHQTEKGIIATKAAELIQPNTSVFITAGSTCAELAKRLPPIPMCVFSDGLYTAINFPKRIDLTVQVLGGEVDMNTMRIEGLAVLKQLEEMHFNISFLGTPGFHPDYGFSYFSEMTAAAISTVIRNSDKVVMLMDSSKVNYALMPQKVPLEAVDVLVTDDMLESEIVEKLAKKKIEIL